MSFERDWMARRYFVLDGSTVRVVDMEPRNPHALNAAPSDGWLSFERDGERRSLAGQPRDWASLSDEALAELWRQARSVQSRTAV